ncbi:MAG: hydantoinase/oxoprolinase family protein, partial [Nostoc sp.]
AYGMGLADVRAIREAGVEQSFTQALIPKLYQLMEYLETQARNEIDQVCSQVEVIRKVNLKYEGTNSTLTVNFADEVEVMRQEFETEHKSRYGFLQLEKTLIVESASVEVIQKMETPEEPLIIRTRPLHEAPVSVKTVRMFSSDRWYDTPV